MSVFADSSALVRLYADEPGHRAVRALAAIVISHLARVELPAALWRKQRMGELAPEQARVLVEDFEADYFGAVGSGPRFSAVRTTPDVLDSAARLCGVHGLRAYDAVQLAAALAARRADAGCCTLGAFDDRLRQAALTEGFTLLPP